MRGNYFLSAVGCLSAVAITFSPPGLLIGNASAAGEPVSTLALHDHADAKPARSDAAEGRHERFAKGELQDHRSDARADRGQHLDRSGNPPALLLAQRLAALETQIGIRADQVNAWRDYTIALIDLLAPTRHPKRPGERHDAENAPAQGKDPFDREQKLAEDFIRRAAVAERLKNAITALRAALTADQLARLAAAGQSKWVRIPPGPFDTSQLRGDEGEATSVKPQAEEPKSGGHRP